MEQIKHFNIMGYHNIEMLKYVDRLIHTRSRWSHAPVEVVVKMEQAREKPLFRPPSQRAESIVIQAAGGLISLRRMAFAGSRATQMDVTGFPYLSLAHEAGS